MGTCLNFYSHPDKFLYDHLKNVAQNVKERGGSQESQIAGLFHDIGKINPNFQNLLLLNNKKGYTSHSYLSAYSWLCFCEKNRNYIKDKLNLSTISIIMITILIAKHHSDLPDLNDTVFATKPRKALEKFLQSNPDLLISDFINKCLNIQFENNYSIKIEKKLLELVSPGGLSRHLKSITNSLDFFMNLQSNFAIMIESDKRDASNNHDFNKKILEKEFNNQYNIFLEDILSKLDQKAKMNIIRNELRENAKSNIVKILKNNDSNKRIFSITAPTGSGKTFLLLSLAGEILKQDPHYSIIYSLPFLSITEQVENVCKDIWKNQDWLIRIDSKSINDRISKLFEKLENPSFTENIKDIYEKVLIEDFSSLTFDYPFIITTFVQVFETLLSNKNSILLRLPNFSRTIFIIDEIQALPPRLYIFFSAFLDSFCKKFDCYALLSSATVPSFEIPNKNFESELDPKKLFKSYSPPIELIEDPKLVFQKDIFDRYNVIVKNKLTSNDLVDLIRKQSQSCLIILNTIYDTYALYDDLNTISSENLFLLNTRFTVNNRNEIVDTVKNKLLKKEKIILISTQLIEAGVDLDFPIVMRDMCPLPSLIQSGGRCNRNNAYDKGRVYFFELVRENDISPSELIYGGFEGNIFLNFCKENIKGTISEKDLFDIQKRFFKEKIAENFRIGNHPLWNKNENKMDYNKNIIQCINNQRFSTLGSFKLIDEKKFGSEIQIYIPSKIKSEDDSFFILLNLVKEQIEQEKFSTQWNLIKSKISQQKKKLSGDLVTIHIKNENLISDKISDYEIFGIHRLIDRSSYSNKTGLRLEKEYNNTPI